MIAYIQNIIPILPTYRVNQQAALDWLIKGFQWAFHDKGMQPPRETIELYQRFAQSTSIGSRYTMVQDFTNWNWHEWSLFQSEQYAETASDHQPWYLPRLEHRMQLYEQYAGNLAKQAFEPNEIPPQTIIQVSCTGYESPSVIQRLTADFGWQDHCQLLRLHHMGCYAMIPAVNLAAKLANDSGNRNRAAPVSIFSSELCTLHLNPLACEADQIVANTLFADGAIRIDLGPDQTSGSLGLVAHCETILPNSLEEMTWNLADSRFHFFLSKKIPFHVSKVICDQVDHFLAQQGVNRQDIAFFAIHPGGPRIIDAIQKKLELAEEQVAHSKAVLFEQGNVSSCTVAFIWSKLLNDPEVPDGSLIVSLAFGPGLTLTMNLMQKSS
jgi:predicted naringenin-chalcone synthase